jgi:integrase
VRAHARVVKFVMSPTKAEKAFVPADRLVDLMESRVSAIRARHGQRRGDVLRMGRQHIHGGLLSIRQQKTGTELRIPVHPELRAIIDATPGEHLTFLVTRTGKPYAGDNFTRSLPWDRRVDRTNRR